MHPSSKIIPNQIGPGIKPKNQKLQVIAAMRKSDFVLSSLHSSFCYALAKKNTGMCKVMDLAKESPGAKS